MRQKHLGSTQTVCRPPNVTTLNTVPWPRRSAIKWRRPRWPTSRWDQQEQDQITRWKLNVGWLVHLISLVFAEMPALGRVAQTASTPELGRADVPLPLQFLIQSSLREQLRSHELSAGPFLLSRLLLLLLRHSSILPLVLKNHCTLQRRASRHPLLLFSLHARDSPRPKPRPSSSS